MILGGPKYSTRMFSYDKENRTFVTEISTIRRNGPAMGKLYDDAADEGFTLVSHKTGAEVMYYYVDAAVNDEGEVTEWIFKEAEVRGKENHNTQVTVFND